MEQALEARLEQDRTIIQAVTQREMLKAQLRNKIAAERNNRSVLTPESQALDSKGKPIPGRRKQQNYFVTKEQVMQRVMQRLNIPKDELEEEEAAAETVPPEGSLETPPKTVEAEDSDECVMVGDDDEEDDTVSVAELPTLFSAKALPSKPIVTVKSKPQVAAPPKAVKKFDEIDRALAEIAKQERRAAAKAAKKKTRAKNI